MPAMRSDDSDEPSPSQAAQACTPCRKRKRKCDKLVPKCTLCQRIGRACDYTEEPASEAISSQDDISILRKEIAELKSIFASGAPAPASNGDSASGSSVNLDNLTPSSSSILTPGSSSLSALNWTSHPTLSFPPLFFLDSVMFEYQRYQISPPHVRVPAGALAAIGSSTDLRTMIEHYFSSVHTYFSIISKIRLYQHLANPSHEPGADIALLFLAMKLACSEPQESPPQLYQDVKSLLTYVESQNCFTIQLMQALLLTALYELGHGMFPAAYLTTGHAGRLGHAMGLHDREAPQMLPRCVSWTEQEERRRVWWGIVILDRFSNLGHHKKPSATNDPSLESHLPTDDAAWDRGEMLVAAPLALSATQTTKASPFARTCQAAHLLGKVIRHISDSTLPLDYRYEEALQLDRTLRALSSTLTSESESSNSTFCAATGICYSALLELYDQYSCTESAPKDGPESQLIVQQMSIDGLKDISKVALALGGRIRTHIDEDGMASVSPFVIQSLYSSASTFAWYVQESSALDASTKLKEAKDILKIVEGRWRIAGDYLRIVEATEFHIATGGA